MARKRRKSRGSAKAGVAATTWKWAKRVLTAAAVLIILLVLLVTVAPAATRPWTSRWGATDAELTAKLPGDELVADASSVRTKAITIHAPADLVYSLVVQMGYRRAGWYGWDWFYDWTGSSGFVDGHHSRRVVPQLQGLKPGDRISINKMVGYDVVSADRPKALVLYRLNGPAMARLDPKAARGAVWSEESWVWAVQHVDAKTTRLILRIRDAAKGRAGFESWVYDEPLDLGGAIFGHKTMVGLKNVAEQLSGK